MDYTDTSVFNAYIPEAPLSTFIECLWSVSTHTHYVREKVLPMGRIDLMINLGSPHKVVNKTNFNKFDLHKESWVSGFQTEYIVIEALAETNMVGIRFKPGGAYPFFDLPISEVSNQVVDMDLIWGNLIEEIRERLFEAKTTGERFKLLEVTLLKKLAFDLSSWQTVQFAVNQISQPSHFSTVKALSYQMGISQKHLISQFNKMVGVSPKSLARILKFNTVLDSIDPTQPINWADIAHQCHYYDQAHFNKDF
ncbi:MAG: DUF6597 domain-containing transcriptional factor, partial [Chloroflexota bacterium]